MAVLVGATGTVLAFEPRREAARRLQRVAQALRLQHLDVKAAAVAEMEQTGTLIVPRREGHHVPGRAYLADRAVCEGLDEGLVAADSFSVPVVTLDAVRSGLEAPIDFIKCDVEGGELAALAGSRQILSQDRPIVLCEIEDRHARRYGSSRSTVFDFFDGMEYVRFFDNQDSDPPRRNHVFVPAEQAAALALPAFRS